MHLFLYSLRDTENRNSPGSISMMFEQTERAEADMIHHIYPLRLPETKIYELQGLTSSY
jgi:hypothetical protein